MSTIHTTNERVARTRSFFEYECYDINPVIVFLHVTTGACDDEDTYGTKHFNALDMDDMFREYASFERAVSEGVSFFCNTDCADITRLVGFIYIDGYNGKIEFVPEWNVGRCDWVTTLHINGAGTVLRVFAECTGACGVELYS